MYMYMCLKCVHMQLFIITPPPPQAHDTNHSRVGRVLQGINEQLGGLSVERLLTELVINKGTGTDKPSEPRCCIYAFSN